MKKIIENKKGITLIALVITIIVLLILASVTINGIIKENGIITRTKEAKNKTIVAEVVEKINLEIINLKIKNKGKVSESEFIEILENYGALTNEENIMDKKLIIDENNRVNIIEIYNGSLTNERPNFTNVANEPDITGFSESDTYYVSWNLNSSPYRISESIRINNNPPVNWYDYTEGVNHWANIKTTGGGNDCYWVWIPRYAYKITAGYHTENANKIEVKFLEGTSNNPIDGSSINISNQTGSGNWNVHPAFWFDKNNNGIEETGEQLKGIWVAKFEASSSAVGTVEIKNGNIIGDVASLDGYGGGNNSDLQLRIKPNVVSWRAINVNAMFDVCKNLTKTVNGNINSLVGASTDIDSHLMKNVEWGAVAYLSSSKYGKVDEMGNILKVYNNPFYKGSASITGLSGISENQTNSNTYNDLYIYNEENGVEASTSGNVYGVYDMAGGTWEVTASIYSGLPSSSYNNKLWDENNLKYVDKYTETTGKQSEYYGNITKYGDAVYETSSSGASNIGAWNSDASYFPGPAFSYLLFMRGGHANMGMRAGVYAFDQCTGGNSAYNSFRPVIIKVLE